MPRVLCQGATIGYHLVTTGDHLITTGTLLMRSPCHPRLLTGRC